MTTEDLLNIDVGKLNWFSISGSYMSIYNDTHLIKLNFHPKRKMTIIPISINLYNFFNTIYVDDEKYTKHIEKIKKDIVEIKDSQLIDRNLSIIQNKVCERKISKGVNNHFECLKNNILSILRDQKINKLL